MNENLNIKYTHYRLMSGNVLTVCTELNREDNQYRVGYAICNTHADFFVKKTGNRLAYRRMCEYELRVDLNDWLTEDQYKHYYLAHIAIQAVYADITHSQYRNDHDQRIKFSRSVITDVVYLLEEFEEQISDYSSQIETPTTPLTQEELDDECRVFLGRSALNPNEVILYDDADRYVIFHKRQLRSVIDYLEVADSSYSSCLSLTNPPAPFV